MSSSCDNDDPYATLGVPKDASTAQIKSAYRKLALKHHPDKQRGSEEDKARASSVFTKIGNAYEILSDEDARKQYDASVAPGYRRSSSQGVRDHYEHDLFQDHFAHDSFPRHPSRGQHQYQQQQQHTHEFTDPFELFERVFAEEFGMGGFGRPSQSQSRGQMRSPFDDPFFSQSMGSMGGFGGGGGSPFGMMDQMMNMHRSFGMMDDMMGQMQQQQTRPSNQRGGSSSSFSSFSSSSGYGARESVSTSTQIINGRRQTVTERTVVRPDGSVEKHIETSGDDDFQPRHTIADQRRDVRYLERGASEGSYETSRRKSKRSSSSRF